MSKTLLKYLPLIFLAFFEFTCFVSNTEATDHGGQTIYKSIGINEPGKMEIDGMNLSNFDFLKIYQYVIINQNLLFILGQKISGELELLSIRIGSQKSSKVAHFSTDLVVAMEDIGFTVLYVNKLKDISPFIKIEYTLKGKKCIEMLSSKVNNNFITLIKAEIPLNSRTFLCDANNDGYTDVLIWGGAHPSKPFEKELNVMIYSYEKGTFIDSKMLRILKEINFPGI